MPSPDSRRELAAGAVVAGKLRVVRLLGTGGMGAVYEVEHEITRHHRALKVLHPGIAKSPQLVARFLREASAAGRIGNPHIAETFDAGHLESGEPYLLMELLEGETLDTRLHRLGPLDPAELADLVFQACDGVQAAHDAGIVHRDLKPENLFVTATRDGSPFLKILDFGISKFDAERTGSLGVTAEGAVMGTPFYMPPEQVRGATTIDARADVYALGVILYECASGARPYDAQTLEHLAVLIHEGKAMPLAERCPALSPEFCAVVHRAMAVERESRFSSARALGEALAPLRRPGTRVLEAVEPARVVIRTSMAPPGGDGAPGVVASAATITETALADTLGTVPPTRPGRWRRGVAGGVAMVIAVGSLVVLRRAGSPQRTPEVSAPAPAASALAPVVTAPPPPAAQALTPIASAEVAQEAVSPAARATASARSPGPASGPVAAAPPDGGAKAVAPAGKTRVDQNGLAGENPFR
jgi:hypothetical protein